MKNIIFIGMPASGKSTVGVVVAKRLGFKKIFHFWRFLVFCVNFATFMNLFYTLNSEL